MNQKKPIVQGESINFSYDKDSLAIEEASFEIFQKDFLGIIGPNGGGKTTLIKIILGLLKPDQGKISVFGKSPLKAQEKTGYVPQYSQMDLAFPISVFEVILMGRLGKKSLFGKYRRKDLTATENILKRLDLWEIKGKNIGEVSGGQRQRTLIGRALVKNPKILLLDEPTNNVDALSGKNFYQLLKELNQEGLTVVIISHDLVAISSYINRVFCLNKKLVSHSHGGVCSAIINEGYGKDIQLLNHQMHA